MATTVPARPRVVRGGAMAAPAPVRRPRPEPTRRHLRVVDDARLRAAGRRRRARLIVLVTTILVVGCLFALAAFNAMLVTGQSRLDNLHRAVADAQSAYSANRLRVAELEAPEHVVAVAQERLGMVPPPGVTYLTPSEAMADEVGDRSTDDRPAEPGDGGTSWAAVKPYLGSRP